MSLQLYTTPNNPRAAKALIPAEYNGVKIDVVPNFEFGVTNKSKEYLKLNPNGKIPTLVTPEGALWESNAIARYVARLNGDKAKLYGRTAIEAGQVDQWIDWASSTIELPLSVWLYPIWGIIPNVPEATENAKEDIKAALAILNAHLLTRTYLVGERVSLADIIVAATLTGAFKSVFDPNFRKPFPNVVRWFNTIVNQPNVKKVIGEVALATSQAVAPDAPAAAPVAAAAAPAKKEAAPAKKEAPKEEAEEAPSAPAKGINQEVWKRVYSNEDNTRNACKWLWENYNPAENSIWFAEYKYNDELEKTFMSLNLIGGFFQRLDSFRKRGFGTLILFGDNEKSAIAGVFLVSGSTDLIPELSETPDAESYNFTKVDTTDAAQKEKVDNYLCWEVEYNGLKFNQGKVFK